MTATEPGILRDIEVFRHMARITHRIVGLNVDGLTQEDSLVCPRPHGNCLNWVVGHLVRVYDDVLPMVGQKPVMPGSLKRYARGTPPLENPAEALKLDELMKAWSEATERFDAGLASLTPEVLDQPAPMSPTNNPKETVRSLLGSITFHQAYHAGQTGILRRVAGKNGAIA